MISILTRLIGITFGNFSVICSCFQKKPVIVKVFIEANSFNQNEYQSAFDLNNFKRLLRSVKKMQLRIILGSTAFSILIVY